MSIISGTNKKEFIKKLKNLRSLTDSDENLSFSEGYNDLVCEISNSKCFDDKTLFEIEKELFSLKVERNYFDLFGEEIPGKYKYRIGDLN